jgi:hypothetical protein
VTAHRTKKNEKETKYKVHMLPDTPLEIETSDTDNTHVSVN